MATVAVSALVFGATRCADLTAPASIGNVTIDFSNPGAEPLNVIVGDTIAPAFTVMIGSQVQQRARYVYSVKSNSTRLKVVQSGSKIAVLDRGQDTIFATVVGATVGGSSNGAKLVDTLAVIAAPAANEVEFQPGSGPNPGTFAAFTATKVLNATSVSSQGVPVVGGQVDWSTSNANVVTVAPIGVVSDTSKAMITAVGNGTADIITVFEGVQTIRTTITVAQTFKRFRIESSKNTGLTSIRFKSLTDTVTARAVPQDSLGTDLTTGAVFTSVPAAAFALSEPGRVSLTTTSATSALSTARLQSDANGSVKLVANVASQPRSDSVTVTVAQEAVSLTIVGLRQDTIQSLGGTKPFTANAVDSLGRGLAADLIEWSSTQTSVASIAGNNPAVALANAVGSTTIRAQAVGSAAADQITLVVRNDPDRVALSPDTLRILSVNAVASFAPPVVTNTKGDQLSGIPLTYHSLDSTIVLPQANGAMRGMRVGVTRVFVQTPAPNSKVDTSRVEVTNAPAFIDITPTSHTLTSIGDSLINVPITLRNSLGVDLHRAAANWRSGNDNVARVTSDSAKTIIATGVGDTHIYAYSPIDSTTIKDSVRIVVSNNTASLTVSPSTTQTLTALGATINFTATARNTAGNVIPGAPISWSVVSGGTFLSINPATGVATALANGTAVVRATSNSVTADVTVIVAQAYSPAQSSIVPASATLIADGTSSTLISIQLRDANNNALTFGGATVVPSTSRGTLGSVTDAGNGLYTVTLTSSTQAGTATIGATVNTVAISTNGLVAFTAGAATQYVVTSTNLTPVAGTSVTIRAQLADANGNPVATAGNAVTFTSTNGGSFTGANPATTDGTGAAQITFNTSATVASHTITAATGGLSGASPAINSVPSGATNYLVTPASPTTVAVSSGIPITAQLRDANGNSVAQPGQVVTWSKSDPNGSFSSATSTTNAAGLATVTFNTHSVAGTSTTVTATTGGLTGTSALITTAAGVASTATTQITSNVANVTAGGQATITVQARDAQNNDLTASGGTVLLSTTLGTLSTVTDNANGTYTATLSTTTAGTATITGTINGLAIADNAVVTVSVGAASAAHSVAVVGPGTAGTATNITVQARDQFGNNLTTGGSTVQVTVSGANTVAQFTATDVGNGTYTASYTPTFTGTDNVAITLGGTPISGSPYSSVVSAGALSNFLIATIPAQVAGGAFDITLTARDASGNTVTTFSGGANTVDITSTGTLSAGGGTTAAFTNGVLVRSVTISNTGSFTITATRTGGGPAGTSNSFSVAANSASLTNSTIESPDATRSAGQTSAITVTLRDGNNNPLTTSGGTVALTTNIGTLSAVTNNNNGTYSATFTATTVGTATISGTLNGAGLTDTHVITVTVGAADPANTIITAAPTSITANGSATSTISVAVRDAFGNARDAGETVNLATTLGSLSANPATHAGGGVYTATLTAGTTSGTATVTGTLNGSPITDNATVTLTPQAATNYLVTPSALTANAGTNVTVTAQLRDANNNLVAQAGKTVSWSSTNGGSFAVPTSLTNASGVASNTFTVSTNAAVSHVITATDEDALTGSSATIDIIPAAPTAVAATAINGTSFTANWNASTGATSYRLDVATDAGFTAFVAGFQDLTVGGTSQSVTGLSPATTYFYRARAVDATGTSGNSNSISVLTTPSAPTAIAATNVTTTSFDANWNASGGATSYRLDVATDAGFTAFVAGYNDRTVALTTEAVTGLTAGTTYFYRVRAVNAGGTTGNSNTISQITVPGAPTAVAATSVAETSFGANWNAQTGAASYRLDVATDAGYTAFVTGFQDLTVAGTSQSVAGLTGGTTYFYRVRAVNAGGTSTSSNSSVVLTVPAAPAAVAASSVGETSFDANWNTSASAASYRLDVATDAGFTAFVAGFNNRVVAGTTESVTGLTGGTNYFYRVRAVNATGTSSNSNAITVLTVPAAPVAVAASAVTGTSFTANWNAATSATSYRLDVATDAGFTTFVGGFQDLTVAGTSEPVTGLTENTTYFYRVRAVNATGTSANSNTIAPLTAPVAPVAVAATSVAETGFDANWNATTGATSYRLDVATDAGFSAFVTGFNDRTVAGTTESVTGLTGGTTYFYRVRAVNAGGAGASSNTITVLTVPAAPTANAATSVATASFDVSWSSSTGAASYRLDVSTDNGFGGGTFVSGFEDRTVSGTTESVTGLTAGMTYFYRVRAVNASGTSANSTPVSQITVPDAPTPTAATSVTGTTLVANWNATTGAASYRLDVSTDAGFGGGTFVTNFEDRTVAGTSETVTGLSENTTYFYRVRAVNAGGTSANSTNISQLTAPAASTANAATNVATTTFDVTWSAVAGATSYRLDVSTDAGFGAGTFVAGFEDRTVAGTSETVTGLSGNTTYHYRVRAVNAGGTGTNSNTITTVTAPDAPTANAASGETQTTFDASWSAPAGATSYRLDVSTDAGFGAGTFVAGFEDRVVATTNETVTGLTAGTQYFYRVRAVSASGTSGNSNDITVTTLP